MKYLRKESQAVNQSIYSLLELTWDFHYNEREIEINNQSCVECKSSYSQGVNELVQLSRRAALDKRREKENQIKEDEKLIEYENECEYVARLDETWNTREYNRRGEEKRIEEEVY